MDMDKIANYSVRADIIICPLLGEITRHHYIPLAKGL